MTTISLQDRITAAYRTCDQSPSGWASLADIRLRLLTDGGTATRQEIDATLRDMDGTTADLLPEANSKTLETIDHAAAIRIGPDDYHLIALR